MRNDQAVVREAHARTTGIAGFAQLSRDQDQSPRQSNRNAVPTSQMAPRRLLEPNRHQ